jgi:hypothetical protein
MQRFLKIATQMFPAERIESINRNANIGGELGVEVKLFNEPLTFQYTGQYASLAYDVLEGTNPAAAPPSQTPNVVITLNGQLTPGSVQLANGEYVIVNLNGELVNADNIEWVDFAAALPNDQQGIELRLATDVPGQTRQFVGQLASDIYDTLVLLASNQEGQAAGN